MIKFFLINFSHDHFMIIEDQIGIDRPRRNPAREGVHR
jgi:hypothetical protein